MGLSLAKQSGPEGNPHPDGTCRYLRVASPMPAVSPIHESPVEAEPRDKRRPHNPPASPQSVLTNPTGNREHPTKPFSEPLSHFR